MLTCPRFPGRSLAKRGCGPRSARLQSQRPGWARGWWALTPCDLPFQESRIYAVAASGVRLSEVSARSNAACCGKSQVSCPWQAGWACGEERTRSSAQGQVACSPSPPTAGGVQVKARGPCSLGERRKLHRFSSSPAGREWAGTELWPVTELEGTLEAGRSSPAARLHRLPFCSARAVAEGAPGALI